MKRKLVCDLDETLIYATAYEARGNHDFIRHHSDNSPLYLHLRADLQEFMAWAQANFEVSIVTSRPRESAELILDTLGWTMPLTTREALAPRQINGWSSYAKTMNDCIVIEDQPAVVFGENNTVLAIHPFMALAPDGELMRIKSELEKILHGN